MSALPLLHSPADVVRQALLDLNTGSEPGAGIAWPLYSTYEPSVPDETITVYDTAAYDHGRTAPDQERQQHYGVMVRVRSLDHLSGYAKAVSIKEVMDALYQRSVQVDAAVYLIHSLNRTTDVFVLGKEYPDGARSLFTLNALAVVTRTA